MCGPFAGLTEVARRAHDALAEVPLPNPVGHDARRQRILGGCQPIRQLLAPAAAGNRRLTVARQHQGKALGRQFAAILRITTDENMLLGDLSFR